MIGFILIMVVTAGVSLAAQAYVKNMFARFHRQAAQGGLCGAEVAARILQSSGIQDVTIHE